MAVLAKERIGEALAAWLDAEVLPSAVGLQRIAVTLAGIALAKRAPELVEQWGGVLRMMGIADENDGILLEPARDLLTEATTKAGRVAVMGYVFASSDVTSLYETAKLYATP